MFRVGQSKSFIVKRFARSGGDPWRRLRPRTDSDPRRIQHQNDSGFRKNRLNTPIDYKPVFALPTDHPEYQPWSDFIYLHDPSEQQIRSGKKTRKAERKTTIGPKNDILRIQKLIGEENWDGLEKEFPNFTNWRDSWRHAMKEVHKPADYDDLAIIDYERADEKWHWAHQHHLRMFGHPGKTLNKLLKHDLLMNRMFGVTSREREDGPVNGLSERQKNRFANVDRQQELMQWGTDVPKALKEPKDFKNINSLFNHPYESEDEGGWKSKWAEKQRNKTITSKSFGFRVDQDGNTNYDWQSLWPTQKSYKDSLVPLDLRAGAKLHGRARPTKFNNNQLNFSPNLLHLTPPAVKAHCKELVKFGTAFPKEYKTDYQRMRNDYPIEFHTTSKCEAAPYQQAPGLETRWSTMYVQMSRLNLDESGKQKMKIFINGRENEGSTIWRKRSNMKGNTNPKKITKRWWTRQQMRFGEDFYNEHTDMIMLESARCPLKHQNEGYLMYLLASYYKNAARTLKAENRGELKHGKYCYEKSRAKQRLDDLSEYHKINEESEQKLAKAIEDLYNKKPGSHRIRGPNGFQRDANDASVGVLNCPKKKAFDSYAEEMKNLLLSDEQKKATPSRTIEDMDFDQRRLQNLINADRSKPADIQLPKIQAEGVPIQYHLNEKRTYQ